MASAGTRIGVFLGATFAAEPGRGNIVEKAVKLAHEAADAGMQTLWFGQGRTSMRSSWRRYAQTIVDDTRPHTHEPLTPAPLPFPTTAEAIGHML